MISIAGEDLGLTDGSREQQLRGLPGYKRRGAMADRTLVSRTNISRSGAARGRVRAAAKRREPRMDALIEIAGWRPSGPAQRRLEDAPGLGLNGVTVLRRANAQALLDRRIKIADRDAAAHGNRLPDDIIVTNEIIDLKPILFPASGSRCAPWRRAGGWRGTPPAPCGYVGPVNISGPGDQEY
jgi:hypothetical protein